MRYGSVDLFVAIVTPLFTLVMFDVVYDTEEQFGFVRIVWCCVFFPLRRRFPGMNEHNCGESDVTSVLFKTDLEQLGEPGIH